MKTKILGSMMLLAALALPFAAQAQGTIQGAERGARQGERDAGPIGAVVGGTLGAVAGTVGGILGVQDRPRFRTYVVNERIPSYRYDSDFRVRRGVAGKRRHLLRGADRLPHHRLSLHLRERPRRAGRSAHAHWPAPTKWSTCNVSRKADC